MAWTGIDVKYVDGGNCKYPATILLEGEVTSAQREEIYLALDEGKYFAPGQVGIPHLARAQGAKGFPHEEDHCWHTIGDMAAYGSYDKAKGHIVGDVYELGTVSEFVAKVTAAAAAGWDDRAPI